MTQMVVEDGVSDWQRSLGAEASAEAPAPLEPVMSAEAAPVTPDRRPSPVEPVAPLPAEPSSDEHGEASEDEGGAVVQRLFVGPSDNVPLLDSEYLGLHRREVGCSATPTMGPSRAGDLTEGEMSDLEDERSEATEAASDVGDVPNEAGRFAEIVFTDQALMAMVGVPVWVLLAALVAVIGYLCLLIGSGIVAVR